MQKEFSVYLDLVRFMAAMVVFLGHAAGNLTGGFLWQLNGYLHAAVMVFFVLSGYVIAFVVDTKEHSMTDYQIARVSRLASVVVPALVVTLMFDSIGMKIDNEWYVGGPWPVPNTEFVNYFLSLFLIQNLWGWNFNPGINVPFWSLSFEWMFYLLFACAYFLKGNTRVISLLLIAALSGPDILSYMSIWLLGIAAYRITGRSVDNKRQKRFAQPLSAVISLLSGLVLVFFTPTLYQTISWTPPWMITQRNFGADALCALLFFIHLTTAGVLVSWLKTPLNGLSFWIRRCAAVTFSLYLFHRPLIQFFSTFYDDKSSIENRLLVIGGTLVFVFTVGYWCEQHKRHYKGYLQRLFHKATKQPTATESLATKKGQ